MTSLAHKSTAEEAGLTAFLEPRCIAVVGASPGKAAYPNLVLANLKKHDFAGKIVVVHPKYDEVDGIKAVASVSAVSERPDLCIIAVRADLVADVLRECVKCGIPAVTIIAAGFAEQNDDSGRALQNQLAEIIRGSSTRVLGPNCLGVASFSTNCVGIASGNIPDRMRHGRAAIVSQSGGVSLAIMLRGLGQGLGLSHLISVGNELDVSVAEWIQTLATRSDVDVILCYIESVRDVHRFRTAVASSGAAGKPVVILRGGATAKGKAAALSHTGALSGDGSIWQGFLTQIGAIKAQSIDHAIAIVRLFQEFGPARGRSIGGFGGGGGLTVLFTDLLAAAGIETPELSPETQRRIRAALSDVTPHNPMDMGGLFLSGDGSALQEALEALSVDPGIDALVFCVPPFLEARDRLINGAIVRATEGLAKPMIVISYASPAAPSVLKDAGRFILDPPEPGVLGLKSWLDYRPLLADDEATEVRVGQGTEASERALTSGGQTVLLEDLAKDLLRRYGVSCPDEKAVGTIEEAVAAADRLGYPIALKILSPDMLHRGIGNGVLLDLADRSQLIEGFCKLAKATGQMRDVRILVQVMAKPGAEFIVGAVRDPELGIALAVGMGGIHVEAKREMLFCIPPVSHAAMRQMLDSWHPLDELQRRHGPIDTDALLTQIVRITEMLDDNRELIDEMDVNPVIVGAPSEGAVAVDALIVLRDAKRETRGGTPLPHPSKAVGNQ